MGSSARQSSLTIVSSSMLPLASYGGGAPALKIVLNIPVIMLRYEWD